MGGWSRGVAGGEEGEGYYLVITCTLLVLYCVNTKYHQ